MNSSEQAASQSGSPAFATVEPQQRTRIIKKGNLRIRFIGALLEERVRLGDHRRDPWFRGSSRRLYPKLLMPASRAPRQGSGARVSPEQRGHLFPKPLIP